MGIGDGFRIPPDSMQYTDILSALDGRICSAVLGIGLENHILCDEILLSLRSVLGNLIPRDEIS